MMKIISIFNIGIALYYIVIISMHFFRPGQDYYITRVLLLNLILMPIFGFLALGINYVFSQNLSTHVIFGGIALMVMAIIIGGLVVYTFLGTKGSLWFLVYLSPIIISLATSQKNTFEREIIIIVLSYFTAFLLAIFLQNLMEGSAQTLHFEKVWAGAGNGLLIMISIVLFAIIRQGLVVRQEIINLLK